MTMPAELPRPDADGNYDSPPLRALRLVWKDHLEEKAGPEQVMDVIAEIGRFAQHNLGLFEAKIAGGESDPDDPGFSLIIEAFELVLEACEHMALEFVDPDPEDEIDEPEEGFFEFGLALLQEATNQMMEGHQLTLDYIASTGQVNCPFCATRNSRENPRCDKCGRALPVSDPLPESPRLDAVQAEGLETASRPAPAEVTENYVVLARAISGWKARAMSSQELSVIIDQVEGKLLAHLDDTELQEQILRKAPLSRQPALAEAVALTQEALDRSVVAIERMRLAFEKEDGAYLELGLSDFEEASRLMVRSFHACKAAASQAV